MKVTCEIEERSKSGKKPFILKSYRYDGEKAVLVVEDEEYIIQIDEFISALEKVKLNVFGE